MQKGGGWVQIACIIAYVLNGRPIYKLAQMYIGLYKEPNECWLSQRCKAKFEDAIFDKENK